MTIKVMGPARAHPTRQARQARGTFAWISKHRRTVCDYEHLPASHEAMILWAMTAVMTRRLAHLAD